MSDTPNASGASSLASSLRADFRFAFRMIAKSPLFTAIVVVTLALGIGLNTAVFSAIDALLLRPLPGVAEPDRIVQLYRTYPGDAQYGSNSIPHFWDVRRRSSDVFSGVSAWAYVTMNVAASDRPVRVFGQMVSADFFTTMGVTMAQGRAFVPAEDEGRGAHPVAVLSHNGWRLHFGADPAIVGRRIPVNGQSVEIIGITAPEFDGPLPMAPPALWMPLMQLEQLRPGGGGSFENRGNNFLRIVARLAPGVSLEQANARMSAVTEELRAEFPDHYERAGINIVPQAEAGIHPSFRGASLGLSAVVMVVVGLLLLVACVNVANLFLARARDRAREMAIRLALGAKRSALLRQLLVESLVFSAISGLAGLLVAWWAISLANGVTLPMDIDFNADLRLSPLVLGFALLISLVTSVLFGLAPALVATRPALLPALKGEVAAGSGRSRMSRGLVVAQMALSMVLLIGAGLFLANLRSATALDKGFVAENLLLVDLDPDLQGFDRGRSEQFYRTLLERLRANPEVLSVSTIDAVPLGLNNSDRYVEVPGYSPAENENMSINYAVVNPDYFGTLGIPLVEGREFEARDDSGSVRGLVVNQRFVDRFWPGEKGEGRTVRTAGRDYTVIGVVPTGKYVRLGEAPLAHMWFVQTQLWNAGSTVILRTRGDPMAVLPSVRSEVAALDQSMPVSNVRTMEKHLGISLLPARLTGAALGVFGVLGLLLAAVGMYGVMAYSVTQRTREIGIRMAIGARARDVVGLIMRQGLVLVLIGTGIGLAGSLFASRLLRSVLYGESTGDPTTFVAVPLVLIAVATLATFVPARRAASVDPAITLRSD
jgi:predicted permease